MKSNSLKVVSVLCIAFLFLFALQPVFAAAGTNFYLLGDINNDGLIGAEDARLALRYSVSLENEESLLALCGEQYAWLLSLDVDRNNEIDAADARQILRWSVNLDNPDEKEYTYSKTAVDAICKEYDAKNVQAAVVRNGKVVGSYNYGIADNNNTPITDNTKFRCASLSKLMTFSVCMALYDAEILDIDADISTYMGYTVRNPYYPNNPITLRMLMTHTAGIKDGSSFETSLYGGSSVPMNTLLTDGYNYYSWIKPGSYTVYSNFGAAIVGSVCEMASGEHFEDLLQKYIVKPLGLDAGFVATSITDQTFACLYSGSYVDWSLNSYLNGKFHATLGQTCHMVQGNLKITASDYAKFMAMLLNGGVNEAGERVLRQNSVNEMLKVQYEDQYESIGYGTYIIDNLFKNTISYTHTGSAYGFYGAYAMDKHFKNGVVVFTSGCRYSKDADTQIYNVCQEIIKTMMPAFE